MYGRPREYDGGVRYLKKFQIVETETQLPIQGQIHDPSDLNVFFKDLQNEQVPKVVAIYLDADLLYLGDQVFLGATSATLETQLIYHYYAMFLARKVILVMNHPSGDPTPTEDDIKLIRSLMVDASALSFKPCFADFIIVGSKSYWSMSFDNSLFQDIANAQL